MNYLLDTISILLLSRIAFQDFKHRGISWFLLPLLFASLLAKSFQSNSVHHLAFFFTINLGFILMQLVLMIMYFSIKEKRIVNIINTKMGIGDILFFICLCVAFSPLNFIFFYLSGLIFTLIAVLVYHFISGRNIGEIPLAGSIAILMIICIFSFYFHHQINPYDDTLLSVVLLPSL